MATLIVYKDVDYDLDDLWESDEDAAADLTILIEEIKGSERLLSAMHVHQATVERVHVSRLLKYEVWGRLLWRLRIHELYDPTHVLAYRVIYACHGNIIYLLAIMHREQSYEKDANLVARIKSACRQLGIPTHS